MARFNETERVVMKVEFLVSLVVLYSTRINTACVQLFDLAVKTRKPSQNEIENLEHTRMYD